MKKVRFINEFFTTDWLDCSEVEYQKLSTINKVNIKFNLNENSNELFEAECTFELS